ncbi:MAG: hypothetical protein RL459_773 [Pseudomonadota bacterium]|jgi:branched-chain amino acid transport system ATP-binding protein
MLEVSKLCAFYGASQVLRGVSFTVRPGEVVALLGRNGSGRTTTARALMGLVRCTGVVSWHGHALTGLAPHDIAHQGVGYVPEHRDVFPGLTVHQNLILGMKSPACYQRPHWGFDEVYALFPQLKVRANTRAGVLSGGEQQMLALGRTLMGNPDLLLIDEPTEGLAPALIEQIGELLVHLRHEGRAVLLIEQKLHLALRVSDRALMMGQGRVVFDGPPHALLDGSAVRRDWLEV